METKPFCLYREQLPSNVIELMLEKCIHHIPVVDNHGFLVDLLILDDLLEQPSFPNPIIIMAGGRGERLKPLTNTCPKPMLKINNTPILEIIIKKCIKSGFKNFYISVNYLKDNIINYFGNGEKWDVEINYIEESHSLGTCGSLSLLPDHINHDIILMNGDVVTELELDRLLHFHQEKNSIFSVCTRTHRVKIPFAVLDTSNDYLNTFTEKPMYEYQINAGVYVLKPELLKLIPNGVYHTTDLIDNLLKNNLKVSVFPIHENWIDIGSPNEFNRAQLSEYKD
jgi:NDP-sugar pyrophosphorylase family protein